MSSEGIERHMEGVSNHEFRHACGRFATGVCVASVFDEAGAAHGLTVSSFTSVSLNPPLVLICIGHEVTVIHAFRRASHFGINILREEDRALSQRFATKGLDKFDGVSRRTGQTGVPLIAGALATLECDLHQRVPAGDHDIFVGRVVATHVDEGAPLVHFSGRYQRLAVD